MNPREKILQIAKKGTPIKSSDLVKKLRLDRTTVAYHLRKLVEMGDLTKTGSTKAAEYHLAEARIASKHSLKLEKKLSEASEDLVFDEISLRFNLKKHLSKKAYSIVNYSFCEMFNNAIDHSCSKRASINLSLDKQEYFDFYIRDYGIGIFRNVEEKFKLNSEFDAIDLVLKGKQTTQPDRHSGEGIFFTSRIADYFSIRSHKIQLKIDNRLKDYELKERRFIEGTEIYFRIKKRSRKRLEDVFKKFVDSELAFNVGEVRVSLQHEQGLMSRSQARRLLLGLEKFDRVVFDFQGVEGVGQAFVDQVFRIFANKYPHIHIKYKNASDAVDFMIQRGLKGQRLE